MPKSSPRRFALNLGSLGGTASARQQSSGCWGQAGGEFLGFFFSTFVRPGDQPEVLCFLLEFLLADLLGLDQVKYPCRGKCEASDLKGQMGTRDAPGSCHRNLLGIWDVQPPGLAASSFPNSRYSPNRNTALQHHGAGGINKILLLWKISRPGGALISPKPPGSTGSQLPPFLSVPTHGDTAEPPPSPNVSLFLEATSTKFFSFLCPQP